MTAKAQFPLSVVIGAVDKVTAPINRMRRSIQRVFLPIQRVGKSFRGLVQATGLDKVASQLGTIAQKTRGVIGEVGNLTRRLGFMAAAAAAAFGALLYSFTSAGDRILATSKKLGVGVEWLQEMEYAADRSGTSIETLEGSLGKLSRNIAEAAAGLGASRMAFDALGVSVTNSDGTIRKADSVFGDVTRSLAQLESQELKNALAARIFGRAGVELMPFLDKGADEIEKLRARARELGIVMSADAVAGAETLGDSLEDLKSAGGGLVRTFLTSLTPALTVLANKLTEIVVAWGPKVRAWSENFAAKLPERLALLKQKFEAVRDGLKKFFAPFKQLIDRFGAGNVAIAAAAVILGGPLLMALGGLAVAITALASPALLIAAAIGVIIFAIYKLAKVVWGVIGPFVMPFLQAFSAIARLAWSLVKLFVTILGVIARPFLWLGGLIIKVVGGALTFLLKPLGWLLQTGLNIVQLLADGFRAGVDWITGLFSGMADAVAGFFSGAWDIVKGAFGRVFGWITDKISMLTGWLPDWVRDKIGLGGDTSVNIGAASVAPATGSSVTQRQEAYVNIKVDAPKGTRTDLKADRGMNLDYSLGLANSSAG